MQWKRWITALVVLPLLIFLILKGGRLVFSLALCTVSIITLHEFFRIAFSNHTPAVPPLFTLWTYASGAGLVLLAPSHGLPAVVAVVIIHCIGAAVMSIFRFSISQDAPLVTLKQAFALIYIPLFLSFIALLYDGGSPEGIRWIFLLLLIVVTGDTGAYYVGSYLGRHKLCPSVSPKKTIEGAVGGLMCSVIFGAGYTLMFLPVMSLPASIVLALVTGLVGQAGDLFESEFKRVAGVKDSGGLLPGHGGFLDRIDSLLFAAPTAYLLKDCLLS
ncbi:MAG: phosphatidate cytidylyltransferase [Desulfobacteraceae bacterium]|nr:MAG: phosphatidate cytidylyltransferase [Desulfobacteraceae bacterium]